MTARSPKPRFRYRLTRLGVHFLFIALFAMMGGSLRGFNLLLVLAGLLVGALLIQWRIGRTNIRGAHLRRIQPLGAHAGSHLTLRYEISNRSQLLPLWMIRVHDQIALPVDTRFAQEDYSSAGAEPLDEEARVEVVSSVGHVATSRFSRTSAVCRFQHRGCYELGPMHLSSSFPFSLVQSEQMPVSEPLSIYVYPRLLSLRKGWSSLLPPRRCGDGNRSTGGTQHDGEFFGLRRWQSGDQVKQIHWRSTARVGEPLVRQFEQRNRHQLCILVDGHQVSSQESFERALEWTGTLLKELVEQKQPVALLVADQHENAVLLRSLGGDLTVLLERLAIASASPVSEVCSSESSSESFNDALLTSQASLRHSDVVVVSTRPMHEAVQGHRDHRAQGLLWRLKRAGRLAWIDANNPALGKYVREDAQVRSRAHAAR